MGINESIRRKEGEMLKEIVPEEEKKIKAKKARQKRGKKRKEKKREKKEEKQK